MLADKVKFGTSILIWLEQCVYAKQCHNNCPKNITTSPEQFNNRVLIDQLPAFFNVFKHANLIAKQLGITDRLDRRFDSFEIREILDPSNDSDFSKWLAFSTNSDGMPLSKIPISKISSQKSEQQANDEIQARFTFTETDKSMIKLNGSSGAIGFFSGLQKDVSKFLDRKFIVKNGGTILVVPIKDWIYMRIKSVILLVTCRIKGQSQYLVLAVNLVLVYKADSYRLHMLILKQGIVWGKQH